MEKSEWQQLTVRSRPLKATDFEGAKHLVIDIALTSAAILGSIQGSITLWIPCQVLLFACMWRWFSILHSCVHGAFFKTPVLNEIAGHIASILSLLPYRSWKKSHLTHHKWTAWRMMDPSLSLPYPDEVSSAIRRFLNICWKLHIPIFSVITTLTKFSKVKNLKNENFLNGGVKKNLALSTWIFFATHLSLLVLLQWKYPVVFCLPMLAYLITADIFVISQHNDLATPAPDGTPVAIPLHDQDRWTRTLKFPPWVSAHIFLWFDKHTLHHLVPFVPHYKLSELKDVSIEEVDCKSWLREIKKKNGSDVYLK